MGPWTLVHVYQGLRSPRLGLGTSTWPVLDGGVLVMSPSTLNLFFSFVSTITLYENTVNRKAATISAPVYLVTLFCVSYSFFSCSCLLLICWWLAKNRGGVVFYHHKVIWSVILLGQWILLGSTLIMETHGWKEQGRGRLCCSSSVRCFTLDSLAY